MTERDDSLGNHRLKGLLGVLPLDTVEYACAYGSGAVSQGSDGTSGKMVDFIVATPQSSRFHELNLKVNSRHYSALRFLGHRSITELQRSYAARVYCNTRVPCQGHLIKYSVIDADDLLLDLTEWRWMYLAGRLQKHVVGVVGPTKRIKSAMNKNYSSALQAALLLLPDKFTLDRFYTEIVSLSYRGDFRMSFGEDRNKIMKIAEGSRDELDHVYLPLLKADEYVSLQGHTVEQDTRNSVLHSRILHLPLNVLWNLQREINSKNGAQDDIEEIAASLAQRVDGSKYISDIIQGIVRRSAWQQTVKNAFSAGITGSIAYSSMKMIKMFRSLRYL